MNHLIHEKSPYLLQHKDNPVNWYAWGEVAFDAARKQNKPIFLSIGYSTCHWCHVMAHDSFEKDDVAQVLNQDFISIKVDREERPDIDEIYMSAIHAMGMRGGWPLSAFLTPDLKPFFGGTFWYRPQFIQILEKLTRLWKSDPEKILASAEDLLDHVLSQKERGKSEDSLSDSIFENFYKNSLQNFDAHWGGFGAAPKFPHAVQLSMLLRIYERSHPLQALQMVQVTLDRMARGGMYDHLGGGFARYSTDERWLIPHFEKMLYDNALLARAYLEAYQVTHEPFLAEIARETLDYVLRVMSHPGGGYYSAEDADSEGEEGKFYAWTYAELQALLSPEEFEVFSKYYGVTPGGNFEHGTNVLHYPSSSPWEERQNAFLKSSRQKLFEVREKRIHPHLDDKILTSWNGLMISAMALGYQVLKDERYLKSAHAAANFIRTHLYLDEKLLARYRDGEARFSGYLDDYAFLIAGLLDLYQTDFQPEILKWALELQERQIHLFSDENGAFFFTDGSDPTVLMRTQEGTDGALPSGNGVSLLNLLKIHAYTGESRYRDLALKNLSVFSKQMTHYPHAFSQALIAYDFERGPAFQVAIIGEQKDSGVQKFLENYRHSFFPKGLLACGVETDFPALLKDRKKIEGQAAFYVCEGQTCQIPVTDPDEVWKLVPGGI